MPPMGVFVWVPPMGLSWLCALLQAVALHARSVEELYELLETLGR